MLVAMRRNRSQERKGGVASNIFGNIFQSSNEQEQTSMVDSLLTSFIFFAMMTPKSLNFDNKQAALVYVSIMVVINEEN